MFGHTLFFPNGIDGSIECSFECNPFGLGGNFLSFMAMLKVLFMHWAHDLLSISCDE